MYRKLKVLILLIVCSFVMSVPTSYASTAEDLFTKAMDTLDFREADVYTKENPDRVAFEIDKALAKITGKKIKKKEIKFYLKLADVMTKSYTSATGDNSYVSKVKAKNFDLKLHKLFIPKKGVKKHFIIIDGKEFTPDNIVVTVGDTIKWTNKGTKPHTIVSSLETGKRALLSKNLTTYGYYEFTFTEPGDYYYHSMVFKKMIGKVTVVKMEVPAGSVIDSEGKETKKSVTVSEDPVEDVPIARPGENDEAKQKRIDELLKKFDYNPDN